MEPNALTSPLKLPHRFTLFYRMRRKTDGDFAEYQTKKGKPTADHTIGFPSLNRTAIESSRLILPRSALRTYRAKLLGSSRNC